MSNPEGLLSLIEQARLFAEELLARKFPEANAEYAERPRKTPRTQRTRPPK